VSDVSPDAPETPTASEPGRAVAVRLPLARVWATYVIMGLIGLVFAAQLATEQLVGQDLVIIFGAKINSAVLRGEVWRLLTAVFIHGGLIHFLFNMYALYYLGQQVEAFAGALRFVLIFLYAGLAGSTFSLLLNPGASVGASGGIFGLIGALGVFFFRNRALFGARGRQQLQGIMAIVVINLLIGLQERIDNWAHLGGLLGGLALGWAIGPVWRLRWEPALGQGAAADDIQPLAERRAPLLALTAGLLAVIFLAIIGMQSSAF
jgi:rhomboid protease GluP